MAVYIIEKGEKKELKETKIVKPRPKSKPTKRELDIKNTSYIKGTFKHLG